MSYSVIDIIDKQIEIKSKILDSYSCLLNADNLDNKIKLVTMILINQIKKQIDDCKKRKYYWIENNVEEDIEINLIAFNVVSKMSTEFKKKIRSPNYNNINDLLKYAVNMEEQMLGLLFETKNKMFIRKEDIKEKAYEIVDEMIGLSEQRIDNLKQFFKK